MGRFSKESVFLHLILIALLGLLAYSNTFNVPFQLDGYNFIMENPIIKDFTYFLEPSKAQGSGLLYDSFKDRYIGYLTFAVNYSIHGLDVRGYHVFNITIHILNALLVYLFVMLTFRTPFLAGSSLKEHSGYIALFTALLFVSHPVQTEAVTYIMQRLASLATFFYLLSLVFYIKWRSAQTLLSKKSLAVYLLSLVSAVIAMKTKENAFTLPLVITLYEFFFFRGPVKTRILRLTPLLLTLFIIPLTFMGNDPPRGEIISRIDSVTRYYIADMPRLDYLLTQFRVIVTYIRLLFLPVNQNLIYDYPVYNTFLNFQVFLSFLFLSSILSSGIYLLYRSRFGIPDLRLIAFGIFWFFVTLSVESSIIPLPMTIFEYRLYLPSAGAFLAITAGASLLLRRLKNKKIKAFAVSSFILVPLVFSYAAYARNSVWESEISLWEDVVRKSPGKAKGHYNLSLAYIYKGQIEKAVEHFRITLKIKPDYPEVVKNLDVDYVSKDLIDKAVERFKTYHAITHTGLGNDYSAKGSIDKAMEHYRIALRLKPDLVVAHRNLGIAYASGGLSEKAIKHFQTVLRLRPYNADVHNNLGVVYASEGLIDMAIEHFQKAVRLKPGFAEAHNNLGNAYKDKGLTEKAIEHYNTALRLNPGITDAHFNLGLIYFEGGFPDKARREFEAVLRLTPDDYQARRFLDETIPLR